MLIDLPFHLKNRQCNIVKRFQDSFSRGIVRGFLGIFSIKPLEVFLSLTQLSMDYKFNQGKQAQS
jgi:hypothetical protein